MVVENYPQLKASENFMHLQRTLVELEEQIAAARRAFNAAVLDYNNAVQMFPTNIAASVMGYKRKDFFEIEEEEKKKADVKIN
jgi:LemA protein